MQFCLIVTGSRVLANARNLRNARDAESQNIAVALINWSVRNVASALQENWYWLIGSLGALECSASIRLYEDRKQETKGTGRSSLRVAFLVKDGKTIYMRKEYGWETEMSIDWCSFYCSSLYSKEISFYCDGLCRTRMYYSVLSFRFKYFIQISSILTQLPFPPQ